MIIPNFGIGTWPLAGDYWGEQTHSNSLKTIHSALREGFTLFDTAPVYGKGRSEQLLGQQLSKLREQIIISSKCFIKPIDQIEKSFSSSLKRLNTDYIDIFFIHWPSTSIDCRPMVELLEKFRDQGKIRQIGVSNFNETELKLAMEAGNIEIVQNAFNFFWNMDKEYFKFCKSKNITTQAYSALAQGLLTGKFTRENPYIREDLRFKMTLFDSQNLEIIYAYIDELSLVAKRENVSLHNLVLQWTISNPYIDSILVGCRTRKQVEEFANARKISISQDSISKINSLSEDVSVLIKAEKNIFNHYY